MPNPRPYAPPTLPSALSAFLGTHPYQFPLAERTKRELQVLQAVINMPGTAPPNAGDVTVNATLPPIPPPQEILIGGPPSAAPQSVYENARYGEAQMKQIVYAAAGSQMVLDRPPTKRAWLILTNTLAVGNMTVNFDADAGLAYGIPLTPGASLFFDVFVPQNRIYVYAPIAAVLVVGWSNLDPKAAA